MNQLKYLFLSAIALGCSACSNDDTDKTDPQIQAERKALTAATQYGIYQNGQASFVFDKNLHQLYVNPSKYIYRIQNDLGTKYAEVALQAAPSKKQGTTGTLTQNVGITSVAPNDLILLKSDREHLWLWSDDTHTGFIVPQIDL